MQNLQNHRRVDWGRVIAFLIVVLFWCVGIYTAYMTYGFVYFEDTPQPGIDFVGYLLQLSLLFGALIFATILVLKMRMYSTKLQDRIIRQEVTFRYFTMAGKTLNPKITLQQMIALRFAGDYEFLDLCEKAAHLGLSPKEIKTMIKHRQADEVRV